MQFKKIAFALLIIAISTYSCAKDNLGDDPQDTNPKENGINMSLASEGTYPDAERVYLDANLKSASKDKASFYLKKQLLGKQLVPNDAVTYDYWKDKQYFKDTPIINYIYHYYDVKDDKLYFSANASELEGYTHYIFDGLAMWVQKNGKTRLTGGYSYGKLHGDFALGDENGDVLERFWYTNGVKSSVILKKEDFHSSMVARWEAELENDGYLKVTQVYDLKGEGTLEFYQSSYIKNRTTGEWMRATSNTDNPKGLWKYVKKTDNSGTLEFYYRGVLAMKTDVKIMNAKEITLKSTYLDKQFDQKDLGKELRFLRK